MDAEPGRRTTRAATIGFALECKLSAADCARWIWRALLSGLPASHGHSGDRSILSQGKSATHQPNGRDGHVQGNTGSISAPPLWSLICPSVSYSATGWPWVGHKLQRTANAAYQ